MKNALIESLILLCFVGLLGGCSDPKAANDKNFSVAISDYLKTVPACTALDFGGLPDDAQVYPVSSGGSLSSTRAPTLEDFFGKNPKARAFVDSGLIVIAMTQRDGKDFLGKPETQYFAHASLTATGRAVYRVIPSTFLGDRAGFCYAQKHLVSIDNFTEPADAFGQMASDVHYTWKLGEVADWAKNPKLQQVDPEIARNVDEVAKPVTDSMGMVLTNKGWMAIALLRK